MSYSVLSTCPSYLKHENDWRGPVITNNRTGEVNYGSSPAATYVTTDTTVDKTDKK